MNTEKTVILARTRHDPVTEYTHRWSEEIKSLFEGNGWQVADYEIDRATRGAVEAALKTAPPGSVFVFYGHGDPDALIGQDYNPVCDLENAGLLRHCKVLAMACSSAQEDGGLGPMAIEKGALVYFGYAKEIHSQLLDSKSVPMDTELTQMIEAFHECANASVAAWILQPGLTAARIKQKMLEVYDHWILHYGSPNGPGFRDRRTHKISINLLHNMKALRLLGDEKMCLTCPVS
ncbi:MAG: hypothetical protein BECKG1743D_GA0114223_101278 [Candidatus Kentron sp. G]|nr:MAG: hypothetical protein BECKG1743F_GA0114225_100778 [Candidatus Kentron sp. G]VFM96966.1 MAG: hypothetical protein BECKG1743E_GA0114224_101019 [Candidatus Kentron sp. G]VFM99506.1 MAG: hypothetical protein BECKG1743D_GA0114223_101278 [Candidatus Kentron sp. G]